MQPKISVIIPVYNVDKYLRQCLDSVVNQTLEDIEIICVDDGSTDNSYAILMEYAQKDTRFKILKQNNQHAGVARNKGIKIASGEYIHFLDSDDYIDTDAYAEWYQVAKENDLDVCVCFQERFDNKTGEIKRVDKVIGNELKILNFKDDPKYFIYNVVVPWNKIYKREFLLAKKIEFEALICANDRSFYFKTILAAQKIGILPKYWMHYRVNNDKSLVGETRLKHYYVHFRSFETIWKTVKNCSESIKKDVLNVSLVDFFVFYNKSIGTKYESAITKQLRDYLQKMDLGLFKNNIEKYKWAADYKSIVLSKDVPSVIVSLTTYPARVGTIAQVIDSLLRQIMPADKILLWLALGQFPQKEEDLPDNLLSLVSDKFEIRWCDDLKPHKKYFYAMQEYPEDIIITVDDDVIYDNRLIADLLSSYYKFPDAVSAKRCHLMKFGKNGQILPYDRWEKLIDITEYPSLALLPTGVGGVLYPPHSLNARAFDVEAVQKLCLMGDDLWLKAMEILNNTPVVVAPGNKNLKYVEGSQEVALWHENTQGRNDEYWHNIVRALQPSLSAENLFASYRKFVKENSLAVSSNAASSRLCKEKEFFVIDSDNFANAVTKLYGYSIQNSGVYENSNFTSDVVRSLDGNGCYVYVATSPTEIKIMQDFYGSYGLYFFSKGKYFAVSNSFWLLAQHLKDFYNLTLNKDYANAMLAIGVNPIGLGKTPIQEIHLLNPNVEFIINKMDCTYEIRATNYSKNTESLDVQAGLGVLDAWYEKWIAILGNIKNLNYNISLTRSESMESLILSLMLQTSGINHTGLGKSLPNGEASVMGLQYDLGDILDICFHNKMLSVASLEHDYLRSKEKRFFVSYDQNLEFNIENNYDIQDMARKMLSNTLSFPKILKSEIEKSIIQICKVSVNQIEEAFHCQESEACTMLQSVYHQGNRGKFALDAYFENGYEIAPLGDPDLLKVKWGTKFDDKDLLRALIITRYYPNLSLQSINCAWAQCPDLLKCASDINNKYPYANQEKAVSKEHFSVERQNCMDAGATSKPDNEIKSTWIPKYLFNSLCLNNVFVLYFDAEYYKNLADCCANTKHLPISEIFPLVALSKLLDVIAVSNDYKECIETSCNRYIESELEYVQDNQIKELQRKLRSAQNNINSLKKDLQNQKTALKHEKEINSKNTNERNKLKRELNNVRNGLSFKFGRIFTWLPRKIMGKK